MRSQLLQTCLFFGVLASASPAFAESDPAPYPACEKEPTESEISAAKGAFEAGQVSFHEADYARSILYWEDAFRRDCTAEKLLLNLARAYELSGKRKRAIMALETYLERRPEASDRGSIEKRIGHLREQVADDERREAEAEAAKAPPKEEPAKPQEPAPDSDASASSSKPIWPVILTGTGVVAAGVGLGLWLSGQSSYDDVVTDFAGLGCTPTDCPSNLVQAANDASKGPLNQRNAGIAITITGGVAAAAGGILWAITWNAATDDTASLGEAAPKQPALTPVITPNYAGLFYQSAF